MQQNNTSGVFDYDYDVDFNETINNGSKDYERGALIYMYVIMYSLIIFLGLPLHTLVICKIICKMKKTAETIWFLGLSITDLVIILFLPFHLISAWEDFTWSFHGALCTTCSYLMFVNMHSTALMLAILSVIRCLSVEVFQCCCTRDVSKVIVALSWVVAGFMSIPSLFQRTTKATSRGVICLDAPEFQGDRAKALAVFRFLSGWLCPFFLVFVSSCIVSLKNNVVMIRSKKGYVIVRVMFVAYFLCWLPYHLFVFFRLYAFEFTAGVLKFGSPISIVLSFLNSCINPIIYILMDRRMNMSWMEKAFSTSWQESTEQDDELQDMTETDCEEGA